MWALMWALVLVLVLVSVSVLALALAFVSVLVLASMWASAFMAAQTPQTTSLRPAPADSSRAAS